MTNRKISPPTLPPVMAAIGGRPPDGGIEVGAEGVEEFKGQIQPLRSRTVMPQ